MNEWVNDRIGSLDCAHESRIHSSSKYLLNIYRVPVFMPGAKDEKPIQKETSFPESPLGH